MPRRRTASISSDASLGSAFGLRLLSLALLVGAALLVWLALPRAVAGLATAPHGETVARLAQSDLAPAATSRAVAAYLHALAWHDDPRISATLGALFLATAQQSLRGGHEEAARAAFSDSVARHRAALAKAPLQPYAWTRLVQGDLAVGTSSAQAVAHLRMAVENAPWEPALVTVRIGLAFVLWDDLDASLRMRLQDQIRHAARLYPAALARQARLHRAQERIWLALEGQPDLLRRFSLAYSRI